MDSVASAHEAVFRGFKDKTDDFLFKVDFKKAYDSVEWSAVDEAMLLKGFGERWRKWIYQCIRGGKSFLIINGSQGKEIRCKRGLRHGDPLSSLLFAIVADGLAEMITNGKKEGASFGINTKGFSEPVAILQYADDTLLFGSALKEDIIAMGSVLKCFEAWFGMKVNFNKSCVIQLSDKCSVSISSIQQMLGCNRREFPLTYLGIPIRPGRLSREDWQILIDRIEKRIAGWKG